MLKIAYQRIFENRENLLLCKTYFYLLIYLKQAIITQNNTMARSDFVIERFTLKNLHVNKTPEQSNTMNVTSPVSLSCDSLGRDLRTFITGMFAVSTASSPDFCLMHIAYPVYHMR